MNRLKQTHASLVIAFSFCIAGCDATTSIPYCEDLAYKSLTQASATSAQVFSGNRDGKSETPIVSIQDKTKIAKLQQFLLTRTDGWYLAAGETYDPASRAALSEFTVEFKSGASRVASFGVGASYFETPGCGFEVVRPMSPNDRAAVLNLLFDTPTPKFLER